MSFQQPFVPGDGLCLETDIPTRKPVQVMLVSSVLQERQSPKKHPNFSVFKQLNFWLSRAAILDARWLDSLSPLFF